MPHYQTAIQTLRTHDLTSPRGTVPSELIHCYTCPFFTDSPQAVPISISTGRYPKRGVYADYLLGPYMHLYWYIVIPLATPFLTRAFMKGRKDARGGHRRMVAPEHTLMYLARGLLPRNLHALSW